MDEKDQLDQILTKLRKTLENLQSDERCFNEDTFESAVQKLNTTIRKLSEKLTEQETDYFKSQSASFAADVAKADEHADNLQALVEGAGTTVQIIGAIEQVIKIVHPWA